MQPELRNEIEMGQENIYGHVPGRFKGFLQRHKRKLIGAGIALGAIAAGSIIAASVLKRKKKNMNDQGSTGVLRNMIKGSPLSYGGSG